MMEPYEETCYLSTWSEIHFRFTWEQYSLKPVQNNLCQASDQHEETALSSFLGKSHVNA